MFAWFACAPGGLDAESLLNLAAELRAILGVFGTAHAETSEPRRYLATPPGMTAFANAVRASRASSFRIGVDDSSVRESQVRARVRYDEIWGQESFVQAEIRLVFDPSAAGVDPGDVASRVRDLVQLAIDRWPGAAAYVSDRPPHFDRFSIYGDGSNRYAPITWAELSKYAVGCFWVTYLGAGLCERLGGVERVLAEAPAPIKLRGREGVWLQLSELPPAPEGALEQLQRYLAPILDWTDVEIMAGRPRSRELAGTTYLPEKTRAEHAAERAARKHRDAAPPIEYVPDLAEDATAPQDVTLNLYFAAPLNEPGLAQMEAVIEAWFGAGLDGAFPYDEDGPSGMHQVDGPSIDGAVLRYTIDFGSADADAAIQDLAERLAECESLHALRIVVGTETVG
ncbi:MAG: hypothetical protein U0821_24610 [Chloroflexota bacterium]